MRAARAAHCSCSGTENSMKTPPATSPCWKMPAFRTSFWKRNVCWKWSLRWPKSAISLTGGLRLPNDETGDCQLFTARLAAMAEQAGVTFRFNTPVDASLWLKGEQIVGVKCGAEIIKGDAYVMAFGSYSTAMLKGLVDIPVYPLKGYSLTIPIAEEDGAPVSTILDETYKIAITRFDQRIRVGGMAEINRL